ncbi:unnamed protein product [Amoebophrya sp. A25]|nr:unnamed protein product [Amoebophrya sp. A25]|eukprot:GSA25T00024263001.1
MIMYTKNRSSKMRPSLLYFCPFVPCLVVAKLTEVDEHGNNNVMVDKDYIKNVESTRRRKGQSYNDTRRKMFEESLLIEPAQRSSSEGSFAQADHVDTQQERVAGGGSDVVVSSTFAEKKGNEVKVGWRSFFC